MITKKSRILSPIEWIDITWETTHSEKTTHAWLEQDVIWREIKFLRNFGKKANRTETVCGNDSCGNENLRQRAQKTFPYHVSVSLKEKQRRGGERHLRFSLDFFSVPKYHGVELRMSHLFCRFPFLENAPRKLLSKPPGLHYSTFIKRG